MNRVLASLCAAALLAGCHSHKTSSPQFTEAANEFNHLYAQELDQAYVDPRMDDVEAKLKEVPRDSLDAQAAQELIARIDAGRNQLLAEQQKAKEAQSAALAPPTFSGESFEAPSEPPDAGPEGPTEPTTGMSRKEFEARFLGCFASAGPVQVGADGGTAELFALKTDESCQKKFPSFQDRYAVLDTDKMLGTGAKANLHKPAMAADAGRP